MYKYEKQLIFESLAHLFSTALRRKNDVVPLNDTIFTSLSLMNAHIFLSSFLLPEKFHWKIS